MIMIYILTILFGSIIGSFLNVCIYRIPRNLSIISPSSRCPSCQSPIRPYDNIPIISYIILRGRCRYCKTPISPRYPLVESLNAILYGLIIWRLGLGWHTLILFAFISSLIVITFIDLDFQIIPDSITLTGIPVGLIGASLILPDPFLRGEKVGFINSIAGIVSGGGIFLMIALVGEKVFGQEAMGGGDIKLMAMIGAFLGWKSILLTTFAASLIGSIAGIIFMILTKKGRGLKIPFGPFLALGAFVSLFFGQDILYLYIGNTGR
jgi:leader peptidase (prepilin peptidase)/N-methyltransferase